MSNSSGFAGVVLAGLFFFSPTFGQMQTLMSPSLPEKVIIDTDIGDDIDDAFAIALALRSPELSILGVTTTFGDTETRARLLDRFLGEAGRQDIPVAAGIPTRNSNPLTQRPYSQGGHFFRASHPPAAEFMLEQIRRNRVRLR